MKRRVVITGMGVVSPIGSTVDKFWDGLIHGKSGISHIDTFDVSEYPTQIAGIVRDFDAEVYMDRKDARRFDQFAQFAVGASVQALQDS